MQHSFSGQSIVQLLKMTRNNLLNFWETNSRRVDESLSVVMPVIQDFYCVAKEGFYDLGLIFKGFPLSIVLRLSKKSRFLPPFSRSVTPIYSVIPFQTNLTFILVTYPN